MLPRQWTVARHLPPSISGAAAASWGRVTAAGGGERRLWGDRALGPGLWGERDYCHGLKNRSQAFGDGRARAVHIGEPGPGAGAGVWSRSERGEGRTRDQPERRGTGFLQPPPALSPAAPSPWGPGDPPVSLGSWARCLGLYSLLFPPPPRGPILRPQPAQDGASPGGWGLGRAQHRPRGLSQALGSPGPLGFPGLGRQTWSAFRPLSTAAPHSSRN